MCLLKRERKDTNCGHEECKNFYMLNKQMCFLNYNKGQMPLELNNNVNQILLAQNQHQQFTKPVFATAITAQHNLNVTRPLKSSESQDSGENEFGTLNKKKLKIDDSVTNDQSANSVIINNGIPYTLSDLTLTAQHTPNVNQTILNTPFLNVIRNNQFAAQPNDNSGLLTQYNDLFSSMLQNIQPNAIPANILTQQPQAFNISQLYSQNVNQANAQNPIQQVVQEENKAALENQAGLENFIKDFQSKTFNLLFMQTRLLNEIKEKNDNLQGSMAHLISEVANLKGVVTQIGHERHQNNNNNNSGNPLLIHQIMGNSTETGTSDNLITYLYGPKPEFDYYLVFKNELPLPLYRERNFKFTVKLVDAKGKLVENANRIPLTIGIYSSENPPKYIDANTAGNKILKGFIDKDLVNGTATFEKIQIKEVTSHFRNGWIFFVVYPKLAKNSNSNVYLGGNGLVVDGQKIKPLILEKVIVKAKKTKEKDQDDSPVSGEGAEGNDKKEDNE